MFCIVQADIMRFVTLTTLFALLSSVSATLKDCSNGASKFSLLEQGFSPDPPVVNQNATLWFYYQVPDGFTVDDGTATYSVTLNGIPFPATVDPLCTQISCPQTPGLYNLTSTSTWTGGVSGKIVSKIEWYDPSDTLLLCSELTLRV
jgi:hypothetical protein